MPSRRLEDLDSSLREGWFALSEEFKKAFPMVGVGVVCTYRTPEEQFAEYQKGRALVGGEWVVKDARKIVTFKDGAQRRSRHNFYPALALDVELYWPGTQKLWNTEVQVVPGRQNPWRWLRDNAARFGLENGGSWGSLHDWPHFQLLG